MWLMQLEDMESEEKGRAPLAATLFAALIIILQKLSVLL